MLDDRDVNGTTGFREVTEDEIIRTGDEDIFAKTPDKASEAPTEKKRVLPLKSIIILVITLAIEFFCVVGYLMPAKEAKPQDRIDNYDVIVQPLADGSMNIVYAITWTPLDPDEPLSWVDIGMANPNFVILNHSENIAVAKMAETGRYTRLTFRDSYTRNQTFTFWFEVNQRDMITQNAEGNYSYLFIPGWFNKIYVQSYTFKWYDNGRIADSNATDSTSDGYRVWTGSFAPGEYREMHVIYDSSAFYFPVTVTAAPFDASGAHNALEREDKSEFLPMIAMLVIFLFIFQLMAVDCYVSYRRGRGFIRSYGFYVHTHGKMNPDYKKEAAKHTSSSSGGGSHGGGGCACACACACAGGGRAGCSQKDTYAVEKKLEQTTQETQEQAQVNPLENTNE